MSRESREPVLLVAMDTLTNWSDGALSAAALLQDRVSAEVRSQRRRGQFLLGRILARRLLEGRGTIRLGAEGRPHATQGWDLSISHSREWVAAAVMLHGRVGLDIESAGGRSNAAEIAATFFSAAERQAISEDGEGAFLAFWTMREAVAKESGGGLALALELDGEDLPHRRDATTVSRIHGRERILSHQDLGPCHITLTVLPDDPYWTRNAALLSQVSISLSRLRIQKL